jgi:ribulose-phosphate 3-epimerase
MIVPMSRHQHLLATSILSADFTRLGADIAEAEAGGADWIHIDVMDGHFAPNLSMGPAIVSACRRATRLPLDVHLMIESPDRLIPAFAEAGATHLTVHIEACPHIYRVLQSLRGMGVKAGVSLNPGTPAEALVEVLPLSDLILVLTVNPGFSGQEFIESMLPKIATIDRWRQEGRYQGYIEVDGGMTADTAPRAAEAGADVFVAAKAVFGHPQGIEAGLRELRAALER